MTGLLFYAALFTLFGFTLALVAVWWFQPSRFNTATHNIHRRFHPRPELAAPPHRTPRSWAIHAYPTRADPAAVAAAAAELGEVAAAHPELAERLLTRLYDHPAVTVRPGVPVAVGGTR